jgi:hypothetical protein
VWSSEVLAKVKRAADEFDAIREGLGRLNRAKAMAGIARCPKCGKLDNEHLLDCVNFPKA